MEAAERVHASAEREAAALARGPRHWRAQDGERLLTELATLRGALGDHLQAIQTAVTQPPPGTGTGTR